MTTADTNLSRLTQLAAAGQLPAPVPAAPTGRDFYVFIDGANKTMKESEIALLLVGKPELATNLPVVLTAEAAGGWKNATQYGITAPAPAAPPAPPAPPAAPPAPPTPLAPPAAPVQAAPAQIVHEATRIDVGAPVAGTNVVITNGPQSSLPISVDSDADAEAVLRNLFTPGTSTVPSIADAMNEVADAGGMAHSLPIAQLKSGNWEVPKQIDPKLAEHMPVGNRPIVSVYVCHRIGATGWEGAGSKGSGNKAPKWRFVLPHPKVMPDALEYIKEVTRHSRRMQMTKAEKKEKFDFVGRMTLCADILCWRPGVGFHVLVVSGYGPASETINNLDEADKKGLTGLTCSFEIDGKEVVNKAVMKADPAAKNAKWDEEFVKISADGGSERAVSILAAWRDLTSRDRKTVATTMLAFMQGSDFDGLSLAKVTEILKTYNTIPDEPRVPRS